jgi:hypothetical protein
MWKIRGISSPNVAKWERPPARRSGLIFLLGLAVIVATWLFGFRYLTSGTDGTEMTSAEPVEFLHGDKVTGFEIK